MAFVKLDTGILDSTVWLDRDERDIFVTALLMAEPYEAEAPIEQIAADSLDKTGFVVPAGWYGFIRAAGPGIVRRALVATQEGVAALVRLGSPDPESRSSDHEGRRLVRVDGGYIVLNFMRYRDKDNTTAERSRRYRERQKASRSVTPSRDAVTVTRDSSLAEADAEADTYVEAKAKAVHLPMHAVAEKDHHHDDGKPLSTANSQSTFEWAMQHAPNGTPTDRWTAWIGHTLETFSGTAAGLRRKLLGEARYLDTCRDPAAVIDAAIERGDDCLTNDWMDEPSGPKQQAAPSSRMAVGLRQLDALARGASLEPADTLQTGLQTVGQLLERSGLVATDAALTGTDATYAAAYQAAKDGD